VKTLRCLIANVPSRILGDILQKLTQDNLSIEVVKTDVGLDQLHKEFAHNRVDLLILEIGQFDLPEVCKDLLNTFSDLFILALVDDGRKTALYFDGVGSREINGIINSVNRLRY